ncbi:glycosyltransferase [Conexibacter sp. W3-3-2]|uniref:glycosyltransferase family 4 protein n=1 Tax=Conexibacter sp. W3-3-2 TaxID=2675227 RepID=UPI0012B6D501|nr:glycosyltransferase family 4 protein [Conexibacter sp. W3-3-2]MTD46202.1 glycosyltransferase [Conexibacter sp. W3-3-2]
MILVLHHRYRVLGGEERAVDDLVWLASSHLGERVERLERDSARTTSAAAAVGLVRGGLRPGEVADAVRRTGADVVHAHNLNPTFGYRALAAARDAGARVVLHLHNSRLVCAVGTTIDPDGRDCTRCHGRDTRPGYRLRCRGDAREAALYATSLAAWSARLVAQADVVVVPSASALERLRALGAPLPAEDRIHVVANLVRSLDRPPGVPEPRVPSRAPDGPALVVSRLAPEKGVELAIDACREAGVPLVVAGDGPLAGALAQRAAGADVTFHGHVDGAALARLRAEASVALVPTRAHESFGLAALESLAAGLPVVATAMGALRELGDDVTLVPPGDVPALAAATLAARADADAPARALDAARRRAAPEVVAPQLRAVYAAARAATRPG